MRSVEALVELIRRRVGVDLTEARDVGSLEKFVEARVRALELPAAADYIGLLETQAVGGPELSRVITAVTNPHTFFFRDEAQFRAARSLLAQQRGPAGSGPVTVWSAGCATGEEPYSLAMICADLGLDVRVLATDINRESLDFAREGRFKGWSLRRCPASFVERYFTREGADTFRVADGIQRLVSFERHNLVEEIFPSPPHAPPGTASRWDGIFCRNVLMYFHRPAAQRVLEGFARALGPEGWLFLSTSEHLRGLLTQFTMVEVEETFAFRIARPGQDRPASLPFREGRPSYVAPSPPARSPAPAPPPQPPLVIDSTRTRPRSRDETIKFRFEIVPRGPASPGRQGPGPEGDLHEQAILALGNGELALARGLLERWVAAHPEHLVARLTLGNVHLRAHDLDEALAAYEAVRERDPLLPEVHYLQGVVYRKLGDLTRAIHSFRHALFLNPRFWSAAFMLAGVHGRAGNVDRQQDNLRHALELLEAGEPSSFFSSHVEGMKDVCISPEEALRHCRRELGAAR